MTEGRVRKISAELVSLLGTGQQIEPFSKRYNDFGLAEAYDVVEHVCSLRRARGEVPVGRKIGFTNRDIWEALGISAPVWNYVFEQMVLDGSRSQIAFPLGNFPEPRIEPEIVLRLAKTPTPDMTHTELFSCLDWIAAGFEIVYSIFPDWKFSAADAAAAYGVHAGLIVGEKLKVSNNQQLYEHLARCRLEMTSNVGGQRTGEGQSVLGGPIHALKHLIDEIARYPSCEPVHAGELITTGTLTEAVPAVAGVTWTTRFSGIDFKPINVRFD